VAFIHNDESRTVELACADCPASHIGKVCELIGQRSQDLTAHATEYSCALGRIITYIDVLLGRWRDQEPSES
jgi:hypothetical protein